MAKYIDKDALVLEIEKAIKIIYAGREYVGIPYSEECIVSGLQKAEDIINTFEVKEVELEKEEKSNLMRKCVHNAYQRGYKTGKLMTTNKIVHKQEVDLEKEIELEYNPMNGLSFEEFARIAKHFFELGIKIQKEG